ncbi:MAG: sigma-70 family RNA polymerase sigma factor [Oscillospiraceae bacterium]|nr:sigma-70 family RNA polymerase sigma factor [Oscillospiraceae bacterium]
MIKRVLGGDADAFEALVLEHQKNVYNLALRMTGSEQDALDVSQEAFLKLYTHLGTFRGGSKLSVWLYRVTYNLCVDLKRRENRAPVLSLSLSDDDGDEIVVDIPDTRPSPESELERRELARAVDEAMAQLSEEHRRILSLREGAGLSYADISAVLGLNEGSVKSRLNRARRALAKILADNGTFASGDRPKTRKEVYAP